MPRPVSLVDVNRFLRDRSSPTIAIVISFLIIMIYYIYKVYISGNYTASPSLDSDGTDYDCIAVQVSKMRGFSRDYDDPAYKAPYIKANADGRYDELLEAIPLEHTGYYPTTYRPPALPAIMAATFRLFGRQFWAIRTVNVAAMAAACALAVGFSYRVAGPLPALACLVLLALNSMLTHLSMDIWTESLACLCVAAIAYMMLSMAPRCTLMAAAQLGVVVSLSILVRTTFALWLPLLAVLLYSLCRSRSAAVVFLSCALAIPLPWFIRNCIVLDAFMPLGVQGMMELPAAYSDDAVRHGGRWFCLIREGYYRSVLKHDDTHGGTSERRRPEYGFRNSENERRMAEYGKAQALAWIKAHATTIPSLAMSKVRSEWKIYRLRDIILCLVGTLMFLDLAAGRILLGLAVINTLVIAATWSVDGRFIVPIIPLIGSASGLGIWAIIVALTEFRRPIRDAMI